MIRVAFLIYDGFQALDLTGPMTAFELANYVVPQGYSLEVLASSDRAVVSSAGLEVQAQALRRSRGWDTLVVPGGVGAAHRGGQTQLIEAIARSAAQSRRVASVCTGAFLLAKAGVLDGRRATTHWAEADALRCGYPAIDVLSDRVFVEDGNVWTSAGIASGIDLALALIQQDYGATVAATAARSLVVPFRRPGAHSQEPPALQALSKDERLSEALAWARGRLAEKLTVERLAERAGLSPRQFARAFTAAVGVTPARAVERLRVESARASIESGSRPLSEVARRSGFEHPDTMRRAFLRTIGVTPAELQRRIDCG